MSQQKRNPDLLSRRSFLGALGTFAAAAPFSLWPMQAHALYNMGAFWKKRRGNGQTSNGYTIGQSLRFTPGNSACLTRVPSSAGNSQKFTLSVWVKRGTVGTNQAIMGVRDAATSPFTDRDFFGFYGDQILVFFGNGISANLATSNLFRDPSAWYHIVLSVDTTQTSQANRAVVYSNGVTCTYSTSSYPAQNLNLYGFNTTKTQYLGATYQGAQAYNFDGYLAEVNFIDGQALDASSFGQTDSQTGQWIPKPYNGTYGTNGFYLKFADASNVTAATLGKDSAPITGAHTAANNWTPTNINTYDQVLDSPTNNFATFNPLHKPYATGTGGTVSSTNLVCTTNAGAGDCQRYPTTIFANSGKWYGEYTVLAAGNTNSDIEIIDGNTNQVCGYMLSGYKMGLGTGWAWQSGWASSTTGDVIGLALDIDSGNASIYKNGSLLGSVTFSPTGAHFAFSVGAYTSTSIQWNGGQGGQSGLTYDSVSGGRFKYPPPAGFKALCTANLPAPTIKNPSQHFNAVTYTGTGTTLSNSSLDFRPDLLWIKSRTQGTTNYTGNHALYSSVWGSFGYLVPNATGGALGPAGVTAFNPNGFTLSNDLSAVNYSGDTFVAWAWKGGTSKTSGWSGSPSLTPTQEIHNPSSGISMIYYTGTGTAATIPHSLGTAPSLIIVKTVGYTSQNWAVYHKASDTNPQNVALYLNSQAAKVTSAGFWNNTAPTSSLFSVGTDSTTNYSPAPYLALAFAEVPGFSKFGSYTGNGNADGPFVYCGFKPRFVITRRVDGSGGGWTMMDTARLQSNVMTSFVNAELSNSEFASGAERDFLSNGFKIRSATGDNASGGTYIFAAFAEAPFKYATAR